MRVFRVNTHEKYTSNYQHWCPQSEQFAGGDHLLSAYRTGWKLEDNTIFAEIDYKSGTRPVTIYHFVLIRDDETMFMPVISNPFVERFIVENLITVVFDNSTELVHVNVK